MAQRLNEALSAALKDEELRKAFAKTGIDARGTTLQESSKIIASEFQKWKDVIMTAGIKDK